MSEKSTKEGTGSRRGVGTVAEEAILAGGSNEEALAAVRAEFPGSKTTMASINWYRNKLRTDGQGVATARELRRAAKAQAAPAKKKKKKGVPSVV